MKRTEKKRNENKEQGIAGVTSGIMKTRLLLGPAPRVSREGESSVLPIATTLTMDGRAHGSQSSFAA